MIYTFYRKVHFLKYTFLKHLLTTNKIMSMPNLLISINLSMYKSTDFFFTDPLVQ